MSDDDKKVVGPAKARAAKRSRPPRAAPDWLARMNARHAVVLLGSRTVILDEREHESPAFLKENDFHLWHDNDRVPVGARDVPVSKLWLRHRDRRQYERVVFEPGRTVDSRWYNLWRGFACEPDPSGSCELFLGHVRDNVCAGNREHYEWVLGFLADMVQRPNEKPGVALVLRGDEGTGKGFLANHVGELFPRHYVVVSHAEHITGRFNAHHQQALLMFIDEAFWAGDKRAEGVLKHLVTDEIVTTELKGLDPITTRNVSRFIVASNEDWVVPAGLKARRWAVIDVADTRKGDRAYFTAIEREWERGGKASLLHFLLNHDLRPVDLYRVPRTAGLLHQKIESMQPHERWWMECVHEGGISTDNATTWEEWRVEPMADLGAAVSEIAWEEWRAEPPIKPGTAVAKIEKRKIHESYGYWCDLHKVRSRRMTASALHRWLKPLLPGMKESKERSRDERVRVVWMPSLNAARRAFEERLAQPIEWPIERDEAGNGTAPATPSWPVRNGMPPRFGELKRRPKDVVKDFT
jgi:Family of unknown function (DUF5906)